MKLPDDQDFLFWDDATEYTRGWHVNNQHPAASDANDGSEESPLLTIQAAADQVAPGEEVVIHPGIYRECVSPRRGGNGPDTMIRYRAAAGGTATISASELWSGPASEEIVSKFGDTSVLYFDVPREWHRGYNAMQAVNISRSDWYDWHKRPKDEINEVALARCAQVFQDGELLTQTNGLRPYLYEPGQVWFSSDGRYMLARLRDDVQPEDCSLEVAVRQQCFAPDEHGLGWIVVSGLRFQHAANQAPWPQFGALSTSAGHHWIIEDCEVFDANAVGIDIGLQGGVNPRIYNMHKAKGRDEQGGHIVRHNHIARCGHTGLCGTGGTNDLLIEDNLIEDIGHLGLEHLYEAAAIKLHGADSSLLRGNTIRRTHLCCGIWMDFLCGNNRLHGNTIHDLSTVLAGIYIEMNHDPHEVDHNRIWNISDDPANDPPKDNFPGGLGISVDVSDHSHLHHNFVAGCTHFAAACHLAQKGRSGGPGSVRGAGHLIEHNALIGLKQILFGRELDNHSDHNLLGARTSSLPSLCQQEPDRDASYNLEKWRKWFKRDLNSFHANLVFDRDTATLILRSGELPESFDGPFTTDEWNELRKTGQLPFMS